MAESEKPRNRVGIIFLKITNMAKKHTLRGKVGYITTDEKGNTFIMIYGLDEEGKVDKNKQFPFDASQLTKPIIAELKRAHSGSKVIDIVYTEKGRILSITVY